MNKLRLDSLAVKRLAPVIALAAVFVAYTSMNDGATLMAAVTTRELPVYNVDTEEKVLSISFDAAWGSANTEGILDILDRYDVKTTFFLVGFWAEKYPELVQELVARGHEVGNHSATHPHMSQLSAAQIREELRKTSDLVESITGKPTTLFRPPYGEYNDLVVRVSREEGYECVQWNVDSLDWKNLGTDNMVRQCTKAVNPGDIVLFHNDSKYILEALPKILEYYTQAGYKIIPVSQLLLEGETWIDHTGKQHPCTPEPAPAPTPDAAA
ncbi:MAG: polysaccharide deacetylase family protein [Clostridia bacterium]|nr:polysaccharide deacetylase family protein [Clostridia bacterium]